MFSLAAVVDEVMLNEQLLLNKERIKQLMVLFRNKRRENFYNDYTFFENFNEIMMDDERTFPHYEPRQRVLDSKRELRQILKKLDLPAVQEYCDVGCGMGYYPRAAAELGGAKSVGIDINESGFYKGYLTGLEDTLSFVCRDVSENSQNLGKFDLVTSFSAFEHFADPPGMLKSMAQLVKKTGYLYIDFAPIYYCTDGYHLYRTIQIPWCHLLFSEKLCDEFYYNKINKTNRNYFNKWSAFDFLMLFSTFYDLKLVSLQIHWKLHHLWFAKMFPSMLPPYGLEELMVGGFEVIYKKC